MQDVIIQACGSLNAGGQFCWDNGVAISDIPPVNTVYVVSDAALALGDAGVLQYLKKNGITVGNLSLNNPAIPVEVLLAEDGVTPLLNEDGVTPLLAE